MSEILELKIPINENTTKKIVALAALTGKRLDEIKDDIASQLIDEAAFDIYVSNRLHGALAEMDGDVAEQVEHPLMKIRKASFAQAEQDSMGSMSEDIAGHSLSGDEDTGSKSLEEEYQAEEKALKATPARQVVGEADFVVPSYQAPNVGGNTEAFLDAVLASDEVEQSVPQRRKPQAAKTTTPKQRRAKISDYTGDEVDRDLF